MIRSFIVAGVLLVVWVHWRAAYTAEVRAALEDLTGNEERLDGLIGDLRDNRLRFHCKAVLADHRRGDAESLRLHLAEARQRLAHLERFAPLRRLVSGTDR